MGTRDDIVAAAAHIMRTRGYAHATTKEIAREAGYSEATLYKHFTDKTRIFLSVLTEQLPELTTVLSRLADSGAQRDVKENLAEAAATALEFYTANFPIAMSLFSSTELLTAHRQRLVEEADGVGSMGPDLPLTLLRDYLAAEQERGRMRAGADPDAAASLLLGACFQRAFLTVFAGEEQVDGRSRETVEKLVDTLWADLAP